MSYKNPPDLSASPLRLSAPADLMPGKPGIFLFECPLRLFDAAVIEPGDKVLACADEEREDRVVMVYRRAA